MIFKNIHLGGREMFRIVLLTTLAFVSMRAYSDITPGASGSPADFPSGLTLAGGTTLPGYEEGSFSIEFDGGALGACPGDCLDTTVFYTRVGKLVTLRVLRGNSNATSIAASNEFFSNNGEMPASIRPINNIDSGGVCIAQAGGNPKPCFFGVRTDGDIHFTLLDVGVFDIGTPVNIGGKTGTGVTRSASISYVLN